MIEVIKERKTVRSFTQKRIAFSLLRKIVKLGTYAPSAHNLQPWKFVVIRGNTKDKISEILFRSSRRSNIGIRLFLLEAAQVVKNADTLIAIFSDGSVSKKLSVLGKEFVQYGKIFEAQSIADAVENMLLASSYYGIGFIWLGIAIYCGKRISHTLHENGALQALLALGYPKSKDIHRPQRKRLNQVMSFHA